MKGTVVNGDRRPTAGSPHAAPQFEGLSRDALARRLSLHAAVAQARRQGNPAQEPEPDLLPDQRRRPRSDPGRRRPGAEARATTGSYPYYRDRALCLQLGVTPLEMLLAVGRRARRSEHRRPADAVALGQHARSTSSRARAPTGTQVLHAVGAAEAGVIYSRVDGDPGSRRAVSRRRDRLHLARRRRDERRRVLGSAQRRLHQAAAGAVPGRRQRLRDLGAGRSRRPPGGDISRLVRSFPGLHVDSIDGTDFFASLRAMREAAAYVRARKGPAFVHAHVHPPVLALAVRRREAVQDAGGARSRSAARSDSRASPSSCSANGLAHRRGPRRDRRRRRARGQRSGAGGARTRRSRRRAPRRSGSISPDVDPTSAAFDTPAQPEGKPDTMVAAINRTLKDEMARNPRIVVFGEDVADASRQDALAGRARQGRRLQADARPAAAVRRRSRLQRAARRSQHRRPRDRHGDARA